MPGPIEIIKLALNHGVIISVLLAIILGVSLEIDAEMWVNDYPPDVRVLYDDMSDTIHPFN